jgi:hypothetical protein
MNMFEYTVFKFEDIEFKLSLDQYVVDFFKNKLENYRPNATILLKGFNISRHGITLTFDDFEFVFEPNCWSEFLKTIVNKPYLMTPVKGNECISIIEKLERWRLEQNSVIALQKLRHSEITILELMHHYIDLISIEPLRSYLENIDSLSTKKVGKRAKFSTEEYQLYKYACHYYVHDNSTFTEACVKTVENHPELVSNNWKSPEDTLEKSILPKYNNHPELSEKKYTKSRNKNKPLK